MIDLTGNPPVPPEDQVPSRCSLMSMEPLRAWFCRGADMTSPAEFEAVAGGFSPKHQGHKRQHLGGKVDQFLAGRGSIPLGNH